MLAQALFVAQLAIMAVVLTGQAAAPVLGWAGIVLPPETWQAMQEKKVGILMGMWFVGESRVALSKPAGDVRLTMPPLLWERAGLPLAAQLRLGCLPQSPPSLPPSLSITCCRQHNPAEPDQHRRF